MITDSSSIRRKEKHERPPSAKPPVELVVLAGLRFLPFVPTQPGLFQFLFSQRLQINKMRTGCELLLPPTRRRIGARRPFGPSLPSQGEREPGFDRKFVVRQWRLLHAFALLLFTSWTVF